ncbi:HNH endonuclease [Spirosoma montaniterrae]|uniref:HNH domain-containing protein n=1 Tax=Spirosoma montaniterrae TaxID=1178516 RepID=A0A1P9WY43_9BACT|nr:HNH endonuclease [Spirosoma montaniterrae]AQG80306.1 hypothetical protein AWR27_13845 [Spirosoma montaniterrae]
MIRVIKDFNNPPAGLLSESCRTHQQKALIEKAEHNFSGHYYRDATIETLQNIYKNKCGYCRTDVSTGASWRVDHYRPKARVKDSPDHDGYYWLAYEWSNLILSCEKCNGRKQHNFPLENEACRVSAPTPGINGLPTDDYCRADKAILVSESPLLLNPELDDPDEHLRFLPNGTVQGKTRKGEKSIELYFLWRDKLITDRKNMTDDVLEKLKKHLTKYLKGEIDEKTYRYVMQDVYEEASLNCQPDRAYSHVATAMFNNFDSFVVSQFPANQQPYISQSFQFYQQGKLWPFPKQTNL